MKEHVRISSSGIFPLFPASHNKKKEVSKEMTKYVTIPELAKLLGKHRFSIYLKVCKGEIKSERAGRMYLIPRSEVERLTKQG